MRTFPGVLRAVVFGLMLLASSGARALDLITVVIQPTNTTVSGNSVTLQGNLRYATNAVSGTTWVTNSSPAASATNLYSQLTLYPISAAWTIQLTNTNSIVIYGTAPLTASISAGWGILTLQTNTGTNHHALMVPYLTNPAVVQTNDWSDLVAGLSSVPTNAFPETATALSNFVSRGQTQTLGNKTITNSTGDGLWITNARGLSGVVVTFTNGYWTNAILDKATSSNMVAYGLSAPGTGLGSTAISGSATVDNTTAIGGTATGTNGSAYGFDSQATGNDSVAIGSFTEANGAGASVLGTSGAVDAPYGTTVGAYGFVAATHTNSVVVGKAILSTDKNQITLGDTGYTTLIPGVLQVSGLQTNTTFAGTNRWRGDVAWISDSYSSMANTNNSIPAFTNTVVYLSGSTTAHDIAGALGGRAGLRLRYWDSGTLPLTIRNLGGGAVAAARIRTRTGNDVTLTNSPAGFELEYSATASEWLYVPLGN